MAEDTAFWRCGRQAGRKRMPSASIIRDGEGQDIKVLMPAASYCWSRRVRSIILLQRSDEVDDPIGSKEAWLHA